MSQVINTNIASLNAQRNLSASQAATNEALQRLSSGLRINSAKDDAAGLAISTRFDSQIKGIAVAIRNSGDGVSLTQTAEGALGSMTDSLQRIRELALQAANGTNSASDREALQAEVRQLIQELGRTAEGTNFNGVKLLDGSFTTSIQVGANAGDSVDVNIGKLTTDTLGVSSKNGVSSVRTSDALAAGDLLINGVSVGATRASDDVASTAAKDTSAIAKAAAINRVSDQTGVTAVVDANTVAGTSMVPAAAVAGTVTINGTVINVNTTADAATSRASIVTAINTQSSLTGVTAVDTGDDALGVTLTAADGRNINLILTTVTSQTTGLAAGAVAPGSTYAGGFTLVANADVSSIKISGTDVANAGLVAGSYESGVSSSSSKVVTANSNANALLAVLNAGDLVISGVSIAAANAADDTASFVNTTSLKTGSAIAIAAAINKSTGATGVTATANANIVEGTQGAQTTGAVTLTVNGVAVALTATADAAANRTTAVAAINNVAGQTGVTAEDNGAGLTLIAADGRNITLLASAATVGATFGIANVDNLNGITTYGTVSLSSGGQFTVSGGTNGNVNLEALGFTAGTFGGAESGQFLSQVDISTQAGATAALAAVDNALNSINSARADLGAIQNRFELTIANLAISSENLSTANSRIKDADFAAEAAALSRSQVLQQAGISILSQANAGPEQVLSLLQ